MNSLSPLLLIVLTSNFAQPLSAQLNEGENKTDGAIAENSAMAPIQDAAGLPRVLIIGDSISIGYTAAVRELLKGKANVHRIAQNGESTGVGLANLKAWLGDGKWDVIHFNFGLHDAKLPPEGVHHSEPDVYEKNLRELVRQMQATGAKLIRASTTPVPDGGILSPTRRFASIVAYNDIALKVMRKNDVAVDDLYAVVLSREAELQRPHDVHFQPEGYILLAQSVAASIEGQLPKK